MDAQIALKNQALSASAARIFDQQRQAIFRRTDRLFGLLMALQWIGAILGAAILSPRTWNGAHSEVHLHLWLAWVFGGVLAIPPIFLACRFPGRIATRHVIAVTQILFSSLLIHISGGRIETHFHVFGSLAFLAFYRDWRLLIVPTVVVAADHFLRGVYWPESVFGIIAASPWRWTEHAAWVVFEDIFLIVSCHQSVTEMWANARRTAELERMNAEREQAAFALHRAKDAAESANRAKSTFLANMSHEIRTPLNAVLGFADILLKMDSEATPGERREYLETIEQSGRHLLRIINDVLDLSKVESGQIDIERMRCAPHEIIADVISILRVRAQEKGIELESSWKGRVPETIFTDPSRFRQLLMNLVGNAIKFTETGSVEVVARLDEHAVPPCLSVDVIDTGIGIEREYLDRIFDPFTQADQSITRRFGGTGLGLTISRQFAHLLGGGLSVQSEPKRGSTFTATIAVGSLQNVPMLDAPVADLMPLKSPAAGTSLPSLHPGSVLLVEDGVTNRKLISLMLKRAGAQVMTAENGRIGVELARKHTFDVILMDMQMPVMDGYRATTEIRNGGATLPIIALTAHSMKGDEERCRAAGCTGYISKPIDSDRLIRAVGDAIHNCVSGSQCPSPESSVGECPPEPLASTLPTDDPGFREIVEEFIDRLHERCEEMRRAATEKDFAELAQLAHWLKGSGGTAGFPALTGPACDLEQAAKNGDSAAASKALDAIAGIARRVAIEPEHAAAV